MILAAATGTESGSLSQCAYSDSESSAVDAPSRPSPTPSHSGSTREWNDSRFPRRRGGRAAGAAASAAVSPRFLSGMNFEGRGLPFKVGPYWPEWTGPEEPGAPSAPSGGADDEGR
jgi:hypothetical protein